MTDFRQTVPLHYRPTRAGSSEMTVKFLVAGDRGVGITSLLVTYTTGKFPEEYVWTVFNGYPIDVQFNNRTISVRLCIAYGQDDYERLRPLSYIDTDVFLICFSVANPASLQNVREIWIPEIRHFCPYTPAILVGCKADCRSSSQLCIPLNLINLEAKSLNLKYIETSALTQYQLTYCFEVALSCCFDEHQNLIRNLPKKSRKKRASEPVAPLMPPAGLAPAIEILPSTFGEQWKEMVNCPDFADVTFVAASGHRFMAHKIILCSAAQIFCNLFLGNVSEESQSTVMTNDVSNEFREQIRSGQFLAFAKISDEEELSTDEGRTVVHTVIELSSDVSAAAFANLLQFLYSGLPSINTGSNAQEIEDVLKLARIFQVTHLEAVCTNLQNNEDFLSIGTFLSGEMGYSLSLKDLFLNKDRLADIVFIVEGTKIYAHRVVLSTRCEVMKAMFSSGFREDNLSEMSLPDVSLEPFLAFLEYIYSDRAPLEDGDSVDILVIANRYFVKRLVNLCELYITKEVERSVVDSIQTSSIDVIGLLLLSQSHNAEQLEKWCLHFIASNYLAFTEREEFSNLKGDNLHYIEEHRWPPVSYLKEVEQYKTEMQSQKVDPKSCAMM